MAKVWADFYDYVLPELPGVPQDVATLHLRSVAIDFFERARIYIVDHDPILIVGTQHTYDLAPPTGYEVAEIDVAELEATPLDPVGLDDLPQFFPQGVGNYTGQPRVYFQETLDTVRFAPTPDSASTALEVTLRTVLRPTRASTGVDNWVFNKWVEVIANGVKSRLMLMPSKPWTNPQLANFYGNLYATAVQKAGVGSAKGKTRALQAVQMRPF